MKKRYLLAAMSLLLLQSCETDRFFGYQYEAEPVSQFVSISGQLVNTFDRAEVVRDAQISFEGQAAEPSDRQGVFSLDYAITGDEQFDRPINVRVQQPKYYTLDTTLIVRTGVDNVVWPMVYGSPRLLSSVRSERMYTTTVFDYQGEQTISRVICAVYYRNPDDDDHLYFLDMEKIAVVDGNTAVYQQVFPPTIIVDGEQRIFIGARGHQIEAFDEEGFTELFFYVEGAPR
ncbi:MAG: hypothetical protein AAFP70_02390 [Calditrichota bacterium]